MQAIETHRENPFLMQMPVGDLHTYGYVANDPVNFVDETGEAGHTTNQRQSNLPQHQKGDARRGTDGGGEKGDKYRKNNGLPRKKPKGLKGPWPPKMVAPFYCLVCEIEMERLQKLQELLDKYSGESECI